MQVQEMMSPPVDIITSSTTSCDAAKRMRDENIGCLPVSENDRLIGMVTDRDIVARAVAENVLPSNADVRTVMSEGVYHCFEGDSLEQAARIMAEHQVRRLPVLDSVEQLCGRSCRHHAADLPVHPFVPIADHLIRRIGYFDQVYRVFPHMFAE